MAEALSPPCFQVLRQDKRGGWIFIEGNPTRLAVFEWAARSAHHLGVERSGPRSLCHRRPTDQVGGESTIATRRSSGHKWLAATRPYRLAWAAINAPCALCHRPINYTLHRNHRESLTVDHIVPLMHDGAMFDPTNWQAAHRGCNASKGNVDRTALDRTARQAHHSWRW